MAAKKKKSNGTNKQLKQVTSKIPSNEKTNFVAQTRKALGVPVIGMTYGTTTRGGKVTQIVTATRKSRPAGKSARQIAADKRNKK